MYVVFEGQKKNCYCVLRNTFTSHKIKSNLKLLNKYPKFEPLRGKETHYT